MTGSTLMPHMRMPVARKIMPPQAVKSVMTALSITRDAGRRRAVHQKKHGELGQGDACGHHAQCRAENQAAEQIQNSFDDKDAWRTGQPFVMAPISPMLPKQNAETSVTRWGARFLSAFLREPKSSRA